MLHEPRFWSAVAFVLFFVLFGKKLWTPLAAALDSRADRIRADLDEAARLRREAEQMLEDATRERETAMVEARALVEHSLIEAARIADEARREAEAVATRREQMARDRIAASERSAVREVRQVAIDVAIQATRDVLATALPAGADHAIVDRAIADLPSALSHRAA
ncbi:H+transporting two-sector ATPase B/B' subunit [Gluconacetobacter diazotrophicus PA1 5]|uniref:ATP synthase subunit b n=2 Tax=Gluconacetobacter diazotrophicus TaxID=33996 RepID=ATPF_GLUDA|nr:ATP synthase subunit B [Gluconacetobacter diazotrophicus]A9HDM4.1 RecName: Full=ATP synthase subunit b; AltName: Full=ATP synthase F(0) sector subunit b; AltName: Full=ATPase subunit I; AltName: Full=F-type ATPase subunit b; Short=F-ATPase subunit b [Gluconacetobacter diazotrophicus PA1 5]ACI51650.1 H+transporting two-sector ATPase B/B' subunit [Gluconacetobacter diazotrophicus PA1 5]MBB2155318.1 ATP synthase subunit B [Gluconacetobacter diazotrophicus]TWB10994.1 F-type H+-transporting ATPas